MALQLNLETQVHQIKAVNAVLQALRNTNPSREKAFANPVFDVQDRQTIEENVRRVQTGQTSLPQIPFDFRTSDDESKVLGIDVKMETGTGKTYTYNRLMLELNRVHGFNKFIVIVPSAPIREGTASFINSDYAREHFEMVFDNNVNLEVLSPIKKKKKGRSALPTALTNYLSETVFGGEQIDALLMTGSMLVSQTMKKGTDQTVLGTYSKPYEAIAATHPVVIIDEPHRFSRSQTQYKAIVDNLDPAMVIRFGATFPRTTSGRGKNKKTVIDYNHLVYDLDAASAFNNSLVKGVKVRTPESLSMEDSRLKLMNLDSKGKTASFRDEDSNQTYELKRGDSLGDLNPDFVNLTIVDVAKSKDTGATCVLLSNDREVYKSDVLPSSVFSETYQEAMLETSLRGHFAQEWENFNKKNRIKTVTLFFIDSIESYSQEDGSPGYLRTKFESKLAHHLRANIEKFSKMSGTRAQQYIGYLKATLANIEDCHGGYFSKDNSTKDEEVKKKVDQILRDKEALISFGDEAIPNTLRFVFSKWTLREGWDAPNVFQIAKLRSSGSEVSKLQEVGRGLRIPVDEFGNRVNDEEFYLTYLIDFSERDFASKLVNEINGQTSQHLTNVKAVLDDAAKFLGRDANKLFAELLGREIIDFDGEIVPGKESELVESYPVFSSALREGKIIDEAGGKVYKAKGVKVRPSQFKILSDLWESMNKRYIVAMDEVATETLDEAMDYIMSKEPYRARTREVEEQRTVRKGNGVGIVTDLVDSYDDDTTIPYGKFLKLFATSTRLPLDVIHRGFIRANSKKTLYEKFFNPDTLQTMVGLFQGWFFSNFSSGYSYRKVDANTNETALTDINGEPLDFVVQGNIGTKLAKNVKVPDTFLFDSVVYDSQLELDTLKQGGISNLSEVKVFGKIPRNSLRIPTLLGGTTSPDFMFVLEDKQGNKSVNLVLESKDYEDETNLRGLERAKIEAAQVFFESLNESQELGDTKVKFERQLSTDKATALIKGALQ